MIKGLDEALQGRAQASVIALSELIEELLGGNGAEVRLVERQGLRSHAHLSRVYRLRFEIRGEVRSLIVKRLRFENTQRSELAAQRWLPAIGLSEQGPPLLGSVPERSGGHVWHVYGELGNHELDPRRPDPARVRAALALVAKVHTRFAGHPLLGEVRLYGRDLGVHFCETNSRDALRALEACRPPEPYRALHKRLLERLYKVREELPARARLFEDWGGPETLLHGDLWPTNIFVIPSAEGLHARLLDWDLSGIGPVSYDVGTFLLRFAPSHRPWVLEAYADEVERAGWRLPPEPELNLLFETQEWARFSNRVIWPAIALAHDHCGEGCWEDLAEVEEWFEDLKPVLPLEPEKPAPSVVG